MFREMYVCMCFIWSRVLCHKPVAFNQQVHMSIVVVGIMSKEPDGVTDQMSSVNVHVCMHVCTHVCMR